jgi:hypothetical protein
MVILRSACKLELEHFSIQRALMMPEIRIDRIIGDIIDVGAIRAESRWYR